MRGFDGPVGRADGPEQKRRKSLDGRAPLAALELTVTLNMGFLQLEVNRLL